GVHNMMSATTVCARAACSRAAGGTARPETQGGRNAVGPGLVSNDRRGRGGANRQGGGGPRGVGGIGRRGRIPRLVVVLAGIVLLINGSARGSDDLWPFGPMSQYAMTVP